MDELVVVSVCAYLTRTDGIAWRDDDFNASKFIKAIKGKRINGYATIPVGTARRRLDSSNADKAIGWAARMLAPAILDEYRNDEVVLVPIPGSSCVSARDVRRCRTFQLAEACQRRVRDEMSVTVEPWLWWSEELQPTHQGGVRDADHLLAHAVVDSDCTFSRVVLIDDVITSGAHFTAAAAALTRPGAEVEEVAFCVGRVVHELEDEPFSTDRRWVSARP